MRLGIRLAAIVMIAAVAVAGASPRARADAGVSLDRGGLFIVEQLEPGGRYTLPTVTVRNPGDAPSAYRMSILFLEDGEARRPDPAWFTFEPPSFDLDPGERQAVAITVHLPGNIHPDDYEALLQAEMTSSAPGTSVGAAAAAPVTFTVAPASLWESWMQRLGGWANGAGIWGYAAAILILSAAAALASGRGHTRAGPST